MTHDDRKNKESRVSPSLGPLVESHIRRKLEQYVLRHDPSKPASAGQRQLTLPFDDDLRSLPPELFPLDVCEVLREFFPDGCIRPMEREDRTGPEGLVLACSGWIENDVGEVPIIFVAPEHLDEAERPSHAGRFAALREVARLILYHFRGTAVGLPRDVRDSTYQVHGGEFLVPGFFKDPLSKWAMCLGCPPVELGRMLQIAWGQTPVAAQRVEMARPICAMTRNGHDVVFMEMKYDGKTLEQVFGLGPHALIGWCMYLGLIDWQREKGASMNKGPPENSDR